MDPNEIANLMLGQPRPTRWIDLEGHRFEVVALSQADYSRIRQGAKVITTEGGKLVERYSINRIASGLLEGVVNWEGVTAAAFPQSRQLEQLNDEDRNRPLPFSPGLLQLLVDDRPALFDSLSLAVRDYHVEYVEGLTADLGN